MLKRGNNKIKKRRNFKDIEYENAPDDIKEAIEEGNRVEDFLPPPELLVAKKSHKIFADHSDQ